MTSGVFDLTVSDEISAFMSFGIPPRYTANGPLSAESATAFAWHATGRRIAQTPTAYDAYDDRLVGQIAGCASWRIVLETPADLTSLRSGQSIRTDTLYVMSVPACFSDSPALLAAPPMQPATQWLRLFNGDSVNLPLRGPLIFDRVSVVR